MKEALKVIGQDIQREIQGLCSDTFPSIFRLQPPLALDEFMWDLLWSEVVNKAPLSVTRLESLMHTRKEAEQIQQSSLHACFHYSEEQK